MTTTSASTRTEAALTEGDQRARERVKMNPQLAKIADRWAREEQQLDQSELEIRYRWATDVKTVRDSPAIYGDRAEDKLFEARMTGDLEPRTYYNVATYIDADFFGTVVTFNKSKRARTGHITWSHLVVFSRLGDRAVRQHLLEQCMTEQWSVATLRGKVDEAFDDGVAESTIERRQAGAGSIAKRLARSAKKLEKDSWDIIGEEFRSALRLVRDGDRDETRALFEAAKQAVWDCKVQLGTAEHVLDYALKALVSRVDDPQDFESAVTQDVQPKPKTRHETLTDPPTGERKMKRVRRRKTATIERQKLVTV